MSTRKTYSAQLEIGFSRVDVLACVLAVLALAALVATQMLKVRQKSREIDCVGNLKQVGLSFRLWSRDSSDGFPPHYSTNYGGTSEYVALGLVAPHFFAMSNELATPKVLVCPADKGRRPADSFEALQSVNISYFVVPEAQEFLPELWLSGDRNLATKGAGIHAGRLVLTTGSTPNWTAAIHKHRGNVCFADGSVQQLSSAALFGSMTNALAATSNGTFQILIP